MSASSLAGTPAGGKTVGAGGIPPASSSPPGSVSTLNYLVRLLLLGVINAGAIFLGINLIRDGNFFLGFTIIVTSLLLSLVLVRNALKPMRWMVPSLALVALLVIYPMFYTVYVSFTNFSDGHRHTKPEAVELMAQTKFLPEGATSYEWNVYRLPDAAEEDAGAYALLLTDDEGNNLFAAQNAPLEEMGAGDPPETINGYALLSGGDRFRALSVIQELQFGPEDSPLGIQSRSAAGAFEQRWVYDEARDTVVDRETGAEYVADNATGDFRAASGATAPLGFWVQTGVENYGRLFTSPVLRGPLVQVFGWTVAFAFFSVIISFSVGLLMALVLNKPFTGIRIVRSLLIVPYAIPGMISILIWRGMLNLNVGIINTTMEDIFGWAPPWSIDPVWAKIAILLVNLWLAYPYFMLICSGALQSIPASIYEAAEVDGATAWEKFWKLTLPLLLVSTGPLLVASFTYNFNNFLLIEALFQGGPPIPGTSAPTVGYTDNLISYTFRYAFGAGGTRDYGFASAIAVVIFLIVGALTLFQFRFTKRLEEVGENV
ncbi:MAG: ABC transporter permease subunit [Chloroflexi bacterium]|nr:ABC transporter permease subunit [Chloroflexota bacterium]